VATQNDIIDINGRRFVTVSALSQILRLHRRTIQLWTTEHNLPLIRIGNLMIFDLDDLTNWACSAKAQESSIN
jgi:excisionase family DNA binding protein